MHNSLENNIMLSIIQVSAQTLMCMPEEHYIIIMHY